MAATTGNNRTSGRSKERAVSWKVSFERCSKDEERVEGGGTSERRVLPGVLEARPWLVSLEKLKSASYLSPRRTLLYL